VAFGLGADQVVRVPFTPDELAQKVRTVLDAGDAYHL